ncbi:short-chain dehydrogenase/reductase SDR [Gemmatirosa kalamazoonensis]|uniref:Short-chain dehydrogenase/reductase SDR n=1 Tax=Gemmatirosa kalamazoonensis TaxID=861299 RepID=W0RL51_9BACT|nr:SDR family oxidoreductase [Gemmatirosa kalamazoonensis]AHG91055.1 short-chain dehydrogenase/reductase SDR [Gemmatirosa kalamazoonensis]
MIDLRGRRAVVTGGSRGIGAAVVRALAACGADVLVGYRARGEDADAVAADARSVGVRAESCSADLSTRDGVRGLFARAREALGGVDILVANAGVWPSEDVPVERLDDERWLRTMRENVDSMFYCAREAARVMGDGGRIVMISSTAGQRGEAFHADYAASKGAMISFVKSLAVELGPRGITVNSVAPGWVDTEMTADAMASGGRERIAATIPVGRVASPDDIAFPVVCLCAPQARHVTGEILNVNGGSVLCG